MSGGYTVRAARRDDMEGVLMSGGYTVRAARRDDMEGVLKLVLAQGWNNVIEHLHWQFDAFPAGVFVAESSDGEIISHCSSIPLDDSNGFMAFYITKKSCQGQGIGRQVFDLSFKALGNRNISLNSAWDKKDMYASGYFKVATFALVSYEFQIKNLKLPTEQTQHSFTILDTKDVDIQKILTYDKKIHPMPREKIIKWFVGFAHVGRVAIDGDEVTGWGTLYKTHRGYRLMPLYSHTPEVAAALAEDLLKQVVVEPEAQVEICFPDDNSAAKKLYDDIGAFNGECSSSKNQRLFTDKDIPVRTHLVYSVLNYDQVLC